MKQAIIDIGSNSMRLTVYELGENDFHILFREKNMAGLAGYVEQGCLSAEGIERACAGLTEFAATTAALGIERVAVFATASLRNIENTAQAVAAIRDATGLSVEVLSGMDEAFYGYTGAMREQLLEQGAYIDIGGASTEIAVFAPDAPLRAASFPVGSLSLYRSCVKKILPGEGSLRRMETAIDQALEHCGFDFTPQRRLICVGGTSRAVLKLCKRIYALPPDCCQVSAEQLEQLCTQLCRCDRAAADLILKLEPDRIHTLIPGTLILRHLVRLFGKPDFLVSSYGVREGYLCRRVLQG